jgi:hypothetical protein
MTEDPMVRILARRPGLTRRQIEALIEYKRHGSLGLLSDSGGARLLEYELGRVGGEHVPSRLRYKSDWDRKRLSRGVLESQRHAVKVPYYRVYEPREEEPRESGVIEERQIARALEIFARVATGRESIENLPPGPIRAALNDLQRDHVLPLLRPAGADGGLSIDAMVNRAAAKTVQSEIAKLEQRSQENARLISDAIGIVSSFALLALSVSFFKGLTMILGSAVSLGCLILILAWMICRK